MITAILTFCLATAYADGNPACLERHEVPVEMASMAACMVLNQRQAALWLEDHPKYVLRSWKCQIGVPKGRDS
jgi:hypothetical protein